MLINRQLGRQVDLVYNNLDWVAAEANLRRSVNVGFASRHIQKTKVCLIGHQAPGFTDFHPNPFLMSQTFGCVFQHVGELIIFFIALKIMASQ